MHESGLSEAIVDAAVRRAAGRTLTGMRVRIGGHATDREVVLQGMQVAAVGTVAEDAEIDLVLDPMGVHCPDCGRTAVVRDHLEMVACAGCGGVAVELTGTDDAVLESITVAAPDDAAPAREQEHV